MALGDRVKETRKALGMSQQELAQRIGASQSLIAGLERGAYAQTKMLVPIAQALNVDPTWLDGGQEPAARPGGATETPAATGSGTMDQILVWEKPEDLPADTNRAWIDRYDFVCSAGHGAAQWEVRQKQALPFTLDFFRAIGSNPENCRLAISRGDSMIPFLFDKDMIMIDVSKTQIRDGSVYAVSFENEMLVKVLFKQAGGALTLHSYNPAYIDRRVELREGTHFEVIGQVVYRSGAGIAGL